MTVSVTQIARIRYEKNGQFIDLYCENNVPLGDIHDALMGQKGWVVDRMTKIHQEEVATSEMIKEKSSTEITE